jgi:hypothetical protein
VGDRFGKHFPELEADIRRESFSIDPLHVNNHLDRCMYLYSAQYKEGVGRFSAIGAEQYRSENNQLGPQTRQMSKGHRQDKITLHHGDWNHKKTIRMGQSDTA